jgi:hypothetical protein
MSAAESTDKGGKSAARHRQGKEMFPDFRHMPQVFKIRHVALSLLSI